MSFWEPIATNNVTLFLPPDSSPAHDPGGGGRNDGSWAMDKSFRLPHKWRTLQGAPT